MKEKNKYFVKPNNCPYCTYPCESADMIGGDEKPQPGDISFCLMCGEASKWDENMTFVKFDIDSITDIIDRIRLKNLKMQFDSFWEAHPDKDGRREMYLKKKDELDAKKT